MSEEGSARLLELVLGFIQRLAADQPLMLVLEDLQWAGRSTLDLVALLVRAPLQGTDPRVGAWSRNPP